MSIDDAYVLVTEREPDFSSSESEVKAEKLKKIVRKMRSLRTYELTEDSFDASRDFFKQMSEMTSLRKHIEIKIKKEIKSGSREGVFSIFPNLFHKDKLNAQFERADKSVATRFIELLTSAGFSIPKLIEENHKCGENALFSIIKRKIREPLVEIKNLNAVENSRINPLMESCIFATLEFIKKQKYIKTEARFESSSDVSISPEHSSQSRSRSYQREVPPLRKIKEERNAWSPARSVGSDRSDQRDRGRDLRDRIRDRERDKDRDKDRDQNRDRDRDRKRSQDRDRDRNRSQERDRDRNKSQDRDRNRGRERRSSIDSRLSRLSRRSNSRESRRSRSPRARNSVLDSKELGFGNTRGLSQEDLKLFKDTKDKFSNMMNGVIACCDILKLDDDMNCEVNTNKIVLNFIKFLSRGGKDFAAIKDLKDDSTRVKKMASDLFGSRNKGGSDMNLYT